jgi:aminoglycoside phosphotransferase (APT) family kinase protein
MPRPPALNPAAVAAIVAQQFPHVRPRDVRLLGVQGADHDCFDLGGEWIVRFPKVPAQVARVEIEHRIVCAIADRLPLAVPRFELIARPSAAFPFTFTGYRKLAGVGWDEVEPWTMTSDTLAKQLGEFLAALHEVPLADAERAGVRSDVETTLAARLEELVALRPQIDARLPDELRRDVDEWFARGVIATEFAGPLVLVHNDLLAEHVLVDPQRKCVIGIIDWGDVGTGDPAFDFGGLYCWAGGEFVAEVFRHYRRPHDAIELTHRAAFIGTCLALNDLVLAGDAGGPGRYSLRRALHHVRTVFG